MRQALTQRLKNEKNLDLDKIKNLFFKARNKNKNIFQNSWLNISFVHLENQKNVQLHLKQLYFTLPNGYN